MTDVQARPTGVEVTEVDPRLAGFIYLESRLADEARYSAWESLWDDDALYWVPMHPEDDPETRLSYVYDNRRRLKSRIAQLNTGVRHSQTPPSVMRRIVSNLEVVATDSDTTTIASNFVLYEYRHLLTPWAGQYLHRIRTSGPELKLVAKTVHLVTAGGAIPTMSFLI